MHLRTCDESATLSLGLISLDGNNDLYLSSRKGRSICLSQKLMPTQNGSHQKVRFSRPTQSVGPSSPPQRGSDAREPYRASLSLKSSGSTPRKQKTGLRCNGGFAKDTRSIPNPWSNIRVVVS